MSPQHRLLIETLHESAGEHLRSVLHFDHGRFDLKFVRDEEEDRYTEEHVESVVNELGVESIEKRIKEDVYPHGQLRSTILWFESGVEVFFHTGEKEGIAVGLDPEAFEGGGPFTEELVEAAEPMT